MRRNFDDDRLFGADIQKFVHLIANAWGGEKRHKLELTEKRERKNKVFAIYSWGWKFFLCAPSSSDDDKLPDRENNSRRFIRDDQNKPKYMKLLLIGNKSMEKMYRRDAETPTFMIRLRSGNFIESVWLEMFLVRWHKWPRQRFRKLILCFWPF